MYTDANDTLVLITSDTVMEGFENVAHAADEAAEEALLEALEEQTREFVELAT